MATHGWYSNGRCWVMLLALMVTTFASHAVGQNVAEAPGAERAPRADGFAEVLELIARVADAPETARLENAQNAAAVHTLFRMQTLPVELRYALLESWTMPVEGRRSVRHFFGFLADAPPPAVFLCEPLPTFDDPMVSTLDLLVNAAREAGKLDELAEKLKPLVVNNTKGAKLLWVLVQLERGDAETARPLIVEMLGVNEGNALVRDRVRRSPDALAYGVLIKSAIRYPQTRDLAVRFQAALLQNAKGSANFGQILWLNRTAGLAAVAGIEGASLKPAADPGLKHWVPVDLAAAISTNAFGSTSWWVALDDTIGHVCSPWIDHLVFAYPLTGSFEFTCEPYNDFWTEGNVGFGGLMFETLVPGL